MLLFLFRLCDNIDVSNKNDVANLMSSLAGNFENVVQYNKDNRAFEVRIHQEFKKNLFHFSGCMFGTPCFTG